MKIVKMDWKPLQIELYEPLTVAFATYQKVENILVRIETDTGFVGYGEAAPLAFVTGELPEGVVAALKLFRNALIGLDPLDIVEAHRRMDQLIYGNGSAKCAVDMALYDIAGKEANLPMYRLLGGVNPNIINDCTIGLGTTKSMADRAKQLVQEGFTILKVKAGQSLEEDLKHLTAIREAVGPDIRLRIDVNQGYSYEQALRAAAFCKEMNIEAMEQCFPYWDLESSARLRSEMNGDVAVMLDESIHTALDARKAVDMDVCDAINMKLMKCGGIYEALRINELAAKKNIRCMVGCMFESPLAASAGLHLVASSENITEADCDSFLFYDCEELPVHASFTTTGGRFQLSEKPGLGVEVDW